MASLLASVETLTDLGAGELAARIASGEFSASEVVNAHIHRVEATHVRLNAVVVPLFDQAREAARAVDAKRGRGEPLGPLHGVPVLVKDMLDVAGTPSTLGLVSRSRRMAEADGPLVARLREAGAVILGKTNMPQLGMMYETDNPVYGRTNNPWDLGRSPGGSSGGDAAAVAAGCAPLSLAADGGGRIRHPCHSCGVHGFKPTTGRLSLLGMATFLNYPREYIQPGPIARCVADLELMMRVLAAPGQEAFDPAVPPTPWPDPAVVRIEGLRVGWYDDDGLYAACPAVRRAVREAASALGERGAQVEEFTPPELAEGWRLYMARLWADGGACLRALARGDRLAPPVRRILAGVTLPTPLRRPLAWLFERIGRPLEARMFRALPRRVLPVRDYWRLVEEQAAYRRRFDAALTARGIDVIVCPPHGLPALPHGCEYGMAGGSYLSLFNLLGMPAGVVAATRVRCGEESDRPAVNAMDRDAQAAEKGSAGLPVGVQVAARRWRDDTALAVMAALESHFRNRPDYPARPPLE